MKRRGIVGLFLLALFALVASADWPNVWFQPGSGPDLANKVTFVAIGSNGTTGVQLVAAASGKTVNLETLTISNVSSQSHTFRLLRGTAGTGYKELPFHPFLPPSATGWWNTQDLGGYQRTEFGNEDLQFALGEAETGGGGGHDVIVSGGGKQR